MKYFHPARLGLAAAAALAWLSTPGFVPAAEAATLTIDIPGCSSVSATGTGGTISINCGTGTTSPPPANGSAPSGCTAYATPTTLGSGGGVVNLSVSCSGGTVPTSTVWTRNGATFGAVNSYYQTDTVPANGGQAALAYTYTVTLSNASGSGSASVSVSVAGTTAGGSTGGNTGGGGAIACSGFGKTVVMDMPWVSTTVGTRLRTDQAGGFGPNDALVVRFSVPAGVASYQGGQIGMAEWGGGPVTRFATLSQTPCDFNKGNWNVDVFTGPSITVSMMVGGPQYAGIATLTAGQTYYLNVRNTDRFGNPTGAGCDGGSCNMFLDFLKPAGT